MSSFTIEATCRTCGGPLEYVTGSPVKNRPNSEAVWILRCEEDGHHLWVLRAELLKGPVDPRAAERQRKVREKARRKACDPREPVAKVAS